MASLISRIKSNARGNVKSGVRSLSLCGEAYDGWVESGDWTALACWVGMASDVMRKRHIAVVKVLTGGVMVAHEKAEFGWKLRVPKNARADVVSSNQHSRNVLAAHVDAGNGIGSKFLAEDWSADGGLENLLPVAEKVAYDLEKRALSMVRSAVREGYGKDAIVKALETALASEFDVAVAA